MNMESTKDTVRALDKSAMVLMDETVKIFWLRKAEYKPTLYRMVRKISTRSLGGSEK